MESLELSNFYSIREPQVLDLRIGKGVPDPDGRFQTAAGTRTPRIVALFGANAAGKSTVLKGLSLLSWFVQHSFGLAPGGPLPYERFAVRAMADHPTTLAVRFAGPESLNAGNELGRSVPYRYEVVFENRLSQPSRVRRERLEYWPSGAGRPKRVFDRGADGRVAGSSLFPLEGLGRAITKVRDNCSVISTLSQFDHAPSLRLRDAAGAVFTNVLLDRTDASDEAAVQYYAQNPAMLAALNRDLARLGVGVEAVDVVATTVGPAFSFRHEGLDIPLPAFMESHGTRQLLKLFPLLRLALDAGGVAVIDELDLAIHPLVLPEILRWFVDPRRNPHDAQLWFTCQNAAVLDHLEKEEIFLCDKDQTGQTSLYGLRDVQGVRRGDNFFRKYLGGAYGAVPQVG